MEGGKPVAGRIEASAGACGPCGRLVRRCVKDLPQQWLRLRASLGESRVLVSGGRRPRPGSSAPINLGTDALMRDIVRALQDAAALVGPELNVAVTDISSNPSSVVEFRAMTRASDLVAPHVDRLLVLDGGAEVAEVLVRLHGRCVKQLGEDRQRERLHLPCPLCSRQALVKEVQDRRGWASGPEATPQVVRCMMCNEQWAEAEYEWLSKIVISERDEQQMLKWLLAELNWKFNDAQRKLEKLEMLAELTPKDLEGIDAAAVVAMVKEIVS
jgi:hypothetical protein